MQDASAPGPNPPQSQVTTGPGPQQPSAVLLLAGWLTSFSSLSDPISPCLFPEQLNPQGSHAHGAIGEWTREGQVAGRPHLPQSQDRRARPRVQGGLWRARGREDEGERQRVQTGGCQQGLL